MRPYIELLEIKPSRPYYRESRKNNRQNVLYRGPVKRVLFIV